MMMGFEDDNGKYRNHGEGISRNGKIIYQAPDSILVPSLMKSLFNNIKKFDINKIVLAALFHYYFVSIHPFTDENEPLGQQKTYLQKYLQNKGFTDFGKSFFWMNFTILV